MNIMQIERVSATLRYSAETKGAWRSVEIGAEGSIPSGENRRIAQARLYQQLSQQLKTLWNNGKAQEGIPEGHPQPEHWCQEHGQEYKAMTGQYGVFYSHPLPGKKWCNERYSQQSRISGPMVMHQP
jgi:hypothetical protein